MSLIDRNREPGPWEVRLFGALQLAFFGALAWLLLGRHGHTTAAGSVWGASLVLCGAYYALPGMRRMMIRGFTTLAYPIGWLVSHLLLAAVYYLVLAPVGLTIRLIGDPLHRTLDRSAGTYWVPHRSPDRPQRYFQQF